MPTPRLRMLKGLPASGKSSWAHAQIDSFGGICVSKDSIRRSFLRAPWKPKWEGQVLAIRDSIIREMLPTQDVYVDDTNFNPIHETRLRQLAEAARADFDIVDHFLGVPVHECVARDAKRGEVAVGEHVIRDMWRKYVCKPAPTHDQTLLTCIICDMDGTAALLNGRNPYSIEGIENDLVNKPLRAVLDGIGNAIDPIFVAMSGRTEKAREATTNWLYNQFFAGGRRSLGTGEYEWTPHTLMLHMRADGDFRPDWQVKRDLYEAHILGRYNVYCVFDDRDQVVDLWRSLGLTCFQVADGAF